MIKPVLPCLMLLTASAAFTQVLEPAPAPPPQPPPQQQGNQESPDRSGAGAGDPAGGMPFFDPGTETITWNGRSWNIANNRIFQARFEKYLNAPEETEEQDGEYNAIISQILSLLQPRNVSPKSLDEAFALLPKASEFRRDAGLCDTISNQVYSAWQSQRNRDRLLAANNALDEERRRLERNKLVSLDRLRLSMTRDQRGSIRGDRQQAGDDRTTQQKLDDARLDASVQPFDTRIAEVLAIRKANEAKREMAALQAKIEFQALIVQLFLQRRFEHVLIATRFYRHVFADGDDRLRVKGEAKDLFDKTTGLPPTVGTLDSMASEAIRDVAEGVEAFKFLMEREETESASKRLAEAFLVGEYLPPIRTLPREEKRRALTFVQKANQLLSALDVKDYARAEKLVAELEETAKDFDNSKPMAAIQTAKTIAAMHLAKARNAAVSGDRETLEIELKAATEIWPRNPDLAEVSSGIFTQGNVQNQALVDLDQLLSQKNYRQIFDDKERFIAAVAHDPTRQEQLRKVLEEMTLIEGAIIRAQEIEKRGDYAGAWESAELAFRQYPADSKLNQLRANLTTRAADFVRSLRQAEELENRGQPGSSLAWFLKAQHQYPNSEFARQGIERLTRQILPDAS
jgi:hypothetical protein